FRLKNMKNDGATAESAVMKEASRWIAEKAKNGKVCYNFTMDMQDKNCMFCSQAVALPIDHAWISSGIRCEHFPQYQNHTLFPFPLAYTSYHPGQHPVMRMLNMSV